MRRASLASAIAALALSGCTLIADFGAFGDDELDAAAPREDGAVSEPDGGARDGGGPADAGTPVDDGGVEADAGPPDSDGGAPDSDGGAPDPDGGAPDPDGGGPDPDAGGPRVLAWEMHERIGHGDLENEVSNSNPKVAVSASGDAIVTFYDQGEVFARRYDGASRAFDALFQVSDTATGGVNSLVAMDDEGNGVVAWYGTGATTGIFARRYSVATGWGVIETVQPSAGTGRTYTLTSLDMTGDGHIAVSWTLRHWMASPEVNTGHLRLFARGTGWSAPVLVSGTSTTVSWTSSGLARIGGSLRAVTAWSHNVSGVNDVRAAVYDYDISTASGSLGASTALESGSATALSPRVGVDDAGNAIVLFIVRDGSDAVVVNRFSGGTWTGAMTFNPTGTFTSGPELSVARSGEAVVVWRQCTPCAMWSRRFTGGAWQPNLQVSAEESSVSEASVAVRDDGDALAIWSQNVAATPSVMGAEHTAAGWSTAHPLEDDLAILHGNMIDVALGPTLGVAVWIRETEGPTGPHRKIVGALYR